MRLTIILVFILIIVGCASSSQPTETIEQNSVDLGQARVVSPDYFLDYIGEMKRSVENGKPRQLNDREMQTVNRIINELQEKLTGVENIQAMSSNDKNEVFNATQELWATIHEVGHQRVVCEEAVRAGTRIKSTACRTARQLSNDRNQYREFMRESLYSQLVPPIEAGGR